MGSGCGSGFEADVFGGSIAEGVLVDVEAVCGVGAAIEEEAVQKPTSALTGNQLYCVGWEATLLSVRSWSRGVRSFYLQVLYTRKC